jgi:5-(carboxyamino)imidazole ribonucleotide mutase
VDPRGGDATAATARVAVVMGSRSDWPTLRHAAEVLAELGVPHAARVVSAHRTPERLYAFAKGGQGRRPPGDRGGGRGGRRTCQG